jgi:phosphatidylinositol dimannoside acyltransferase
MNVVRRRPSLRVRVGERVRALGYGAAASAATVLPEALLRPAFRFAADVAWRRHGQGVRQLERNLRRVVGPAMSDAELAGLSRRAMRSYARYWLEFFRLPVLGRERILGRMSVVGEQHLHDAMALGRGAILALPHSGNWDHAGAWVAMQGYPFTTVAERLRPASLFDRFVGVRERLGMEVLPLSGERNAFAVLLARLRAGALVCLVAERDIGARGVEVRFFGESTTMPGGPAALSIATGAALLPTVLWFTDDGGAGGGWAARIHEPVEVSSVGDRPERIAEMTQQMADAFAADLEVHPQDWHMLQPLWLADRGSFGDRARPVDPRGLA